MQVSTLHQATTISMQITLQRLIRDTLRKESRAHLPSILHVSRLQKYYLQQLKPMSSWHSHMKNVKLVFKNKTHEIFERIIFYLNHDRLHCNRFTTSRMFTYIYVTNQPMKNGINILESPMGIIIRKYLPQVSYRRCLFILYLRFSWVSASFR